jgi:GNAT superfamily N-acetyltransferase
MLLQWIIPSFFLRMMNAINIRSAQPEDTETVFRLIKELAEYEQLSHQVTGSVELLRNHLFGERPCVEAILAEDQSEPTTKAIGFALFFTNYSTFLTKPGLYLEDLFVMPDYRGQGIGKLLLSHLAKLSLERDCGRLEWSVLDWNELAIGFYQRIGATVLPDWRICRVTGDAIATLSNL